MNNFASSPLGEMVNAIRPVRQLDNRQCVVNELPGGIPRHDISHGTGSLQLRNAQMGRVFPEKAFATCPADIVSLMIKLRQFNILVELTVENGFGSGKATASSSRISAHGMPSSAILRYALIWDKAQANSASDILRLALWAAFLSTDGSHCSVRPFRPSTASMNSHLMHRPSSDAANFSRLSTQSGKEITNTGIIAQAGPNSK